MSTRMNQVVLWASVGKMWAKLSRQFEELGQGIRCLSRSAAPAMPDPAPVDARQ